MTRAVNTIRVAAVSAVLAALQGCAPPQKDVFYDPWDEYQLGRIYDCGDIQVPDVRFNTQNAATPGLGCAHQSNLTVVVADPADLVRPRAETPPDEDARLRVIEAYRDGRTTAAAPEARGTKELID